MYKSIAKVNWTNTNRSNQQPIRNHFNANVYLQFKYVVVSEFNYYISVCLCDKKKQSRSTKKSFVAVHEWKELANICISNTQQHDIYRHYTVKAIAKQRRHHFKRWTKIAPHIFHTHRKKNNNNNTVRLIINRKTKHSVCHWIECIKWFP